MRRHVRADHIRHIDFAGFKFFQARPVGFCLDEGVFLHGNVAQSRLKQVTRLNLDPLHARGIHIGHLQKQGLKHLGSVVLRQARVKILGVVRQWWSHRVGRTKCVFGYPTFPVSSWAVFAVRIELACVAVEKAPVGCLGGVHCSGLENVFVTVIQKICHLPRQVSAERLNGLTGALIQGTHCVVIGGLSSLLLGHPHRVGHFNGSYRHPFAQTMHRRPGIPCDQNQGDNLDGNKDKDKFGAYTHTLKSQWNLHRYPSENDALSDSDEQELQLKHGEYGTGFAALSAMQRKHKHTSQNMASNLTVWTQVNKK